MMRMFVPPGTEPEFGFWTRAVSVALVLSAFGWLLVGDYTPMALVVLTCALFLVYIFMRLIVWMDSNGFTPERRQVGLTWALIGVNDETGEFDPRPVRVYFLLLSLMAVGLILRPIVKWILP